VFTVEKLKRKIRVRWICILWNPFNDHIKAFSTDIDHHFPLEIDHPEVLMTERLNWSMDGGI
jgi:hypothetical protein